MGYEVGAVLQGSSFFNNVGLNVDDMGPAVCYGD